MKKFINRPEDVVEEMLEGLVVLHPGLARLRGHKVVIRAEHGPGRQVAVISGGGSTNRGRQARLSRMGLAGQGHALPVRS